MSKQTISIEYTSSDEYQKAAEFQLDGKRSGKLSASFTSPIPKGLQVRFNNTVFDSGSAAAEVDVSESNTIEIYANSDYEAADKQTLQLQFGSGEAVSINIAPKARRLKLEASPGKLEFGVLDGRQGIPQCIWKASVEENGQWSEIKGSYLSIRVMLPGGLVASGDAKNQTMSVLPGWLPIITPVGANTATLIVSTGKPGETAQINIDVIIRDDWRKWLYFSLVILAVTLVGTYAAALAMKKRVPMEMEAVVSDNADMSGAVKAELVRNRGRRNFWPFGREVCTLGLLELYPHPKNKRKIILSSVCVQYSLRINGKPPQYYKEKDEMGDYIIGGGNVVGIRENGAYRYYCIAYKGEYNQSEAPKAKNHN